MPRGRHTHEEIGLRVKASGRPVLIFSLFKLLKNDSATALSQQLPRRLILGLSRLSLHPVKYAFIQAHRTEFRLTSTESSGGGLLGKVSDDLF